MIAMQTGEDNILTEVEGSCQIESGITPEL